MEAGAWLAIIGLLSTIVVAAVYAFGKYRRYRRAKKSHLEIIKDYAARVEADKQRQVRESKERAILEANKAVTEAGEDAKETIDLVEYLNSKRLH